MHTLPVDIQWKQFESLVNNMLMLSEVLAALMASQNADVRKSVVFCLVEIHSVVNDGTVFEREFLANLN